jgi:hypothetical protein
MTSRPCISLPSDLLSAYRAAGGPPLSSLTADAIRAWLRGHGRAVPAEAPPAKTAAASAARWQRGDAGK